MYLDTKLNFQEHLNNVLTKVKKTIGFLRKLQAFSPRQSLVTVYKAFIRPYLKYGDIIDDRTYNGYFHQKMESIQHNAALTIAGAIKDTSRENLSITIKKLSRTRLRIPRKRRWCRKLCYFFKIFKSQSPECLFRILPSVSKAYNTRTNGKIPLFSDKHIFFINFFFPPTVIERKNLDLKI